MPNLSASDGTRVIMDVPFSGEAAASPSARGFKGALASLPPPKSSQARTAQPRVFRVPLDVSSLADSDDEVHLHLALAFNLSL